MKKRRIFIDYDGVLFVFDKTKSLEEVGRKGYNKKVKAMANVIGGVDTAIKETESDAEWFILSATLNEDCMVDKSDRLDIELPAIDKAHRIFVPYGTDKAEHLHNIGLELEESDILLDDFTKNLQTWHGVGIKLLNGINNTNGTWDGFVVNGKENVSSDTIAKSLLGIIKVA